MWLLPSRNCAKWGLLGTDTRDTEDEDVDRDEEEAKHKGDESAGKLGSEIKQQKEDNSVGKRSTSCQSQGHAQ